MNTALPGLDAKIKAFDKSAKTAEIEISNGRALRAEMKDGAIHFPEDETGQPLVKETPAWKTGTDAVNEAVNTVVRVLGTLKRGSDLSQAWNSADRLTLQVLRLLYADTGLIAEIAQNADFIQNTTYDTLQLMPDLPEEIQRVLYATIRNPNIAKLKKYLSTHQLEGIVFDIDGVFYDTMPMHIAAWKQAVPEMAVQHPDDRDDFYYGRHGPEMIRSVIEGISEEEIRRISGYQDRHLPGARP